MSLQNLSNTLIPDNDGADPCSNSVPVISVEAQPVPADGEAVAPYDVRDATPLDDFQISRLKEEGFTYGLAKALESNKESFAQRIWIVDNSGSMKSKDGYKVLQTDDPGVPVKIQKCTRWQEIVDCVSYHINLASIIDSPTEFRLLNHPGSTVGAQNFAIAQQGGNKQKDVESALQIMKNSKPAGCTPLTRHINKIYDEMKATEAKLRETGKRVAIIIATDGLPTDVLGFGGKDAQNQFVAALKRLEGLPLWILIRLCTNEDNVVNFYNKLDQKLELSIEVLDDFMAEGQEIFQKNCWLTYGMPMHRLREVGFHDRLVDLLDERLLTKDELLSFMKIIFGENALVECPDPSMEWKKFIKYIDKVQKEEKKQWNPVRRRATRWVHKSDIKYVYPNEGGCAIM